MRYKSKEEWNQVHQAVIAARATGLSFDAACRQAGVPMGSYYNYLQRNGIKKPKKNKAKQPMTNGHFEEFTRVAKSQVTIRVGKIVLEVPPEILPETLRSLSTMGGVYRMRIFTIAPKAKIFVYSLPVNMGCSFPKLSEFVEDKLKKKVQSGDLFLFCNKKRNYLKILYWAKSGYCIFAKRLPIGTFDEASGEEISLGDMHKIVEHISHKEKLRAKSLKRAA